MQVSWDDRYAIRMEGRPYGWQGGTEGNRRAVQIICGPYRQLVRTAGDKWGLQVLEIIDDHCVCPSFFFVCFLYCHSLVVSLICHLYQPKSRNALLVMGTIMLDHKMGGMLDHDLVEYNRWSSIMLDYDSFCVYQEWNIHSMGIMSVHTQAITRTKNPYHIVHLVYHGNLWLIQSCLLHSLAARKPGLAVSP